AAGEFQAREHRRQTAETEPDQRAAIHIHPKPAKDQGEREGYDRNREHGNEDAISEAPRVFGLRVPRSRIRLAAPASHSPEPVERDPKQHQQSGQPMRRHTSEHKDDSERKPETPATRAPRIRAISESHQREDQKRDSGQHVNRVQTENGAEYRSRHFFTSAVLARLRSSHEN